MRENNNPNYISNIGGNNVLYSNKRVNPFLFANASYSVSKAFRLQISASYDNYGKARIFAGIIGDIDYVPLVLSVIIYLKKEY